MLEVHGAIGLAFPAAQAGMLIWRECPPCFQHLGGVSSHISVTQLLLPLLVSDYPVEWHLRGSAASHILGLTFRLQCTAYGGDESR